MSPATSYARLSYGLKHYTDSLRRYIERRVREDWWEEYVRTSLPDEQIAILDRERRQHADDVDEAREGVLPKSGVEFLDARHFAAIFSERFRAGEEITQLMRQVQEAQRRWADPPEGDYPAEEVDQALDAMHDTLAYYQLPAAAEIEALREGGDVPESAYVRLSEELKRHSDGMHRTFRDWAERESPAEWWEQRIGEQRRAALDRYVGDTSRLTTEELIGLLGPADLTAIVLDNCDLSGQERWLLRTVFRVRRNWAHPASGEFPDSYVTEASEWMHEALDTVADAIDELLEPAPDSEEAMGAPAEEEPAQEQQRSRAASVGDYFTCGVVVAFAGALVLAVILVGLALLGTRTWPVDRALDASGAAAGAVGEFVDGITGTSPPESDGYAGRHGDEHTPRRARPRRPPRRQRARRQRQHPPRRPRQHRRRRRPRRRRRKPPRLARRRSETPTATACRSATTARTALASRRPARAGPRVRRSRSSRWAAGAATAGSSPRRAMSPRGSAWSTSSASTSSRAASGAAAAAGRRSPAPAATRGPRSRRAVLAPPRRGRSRRRQG